MHLSQFLPRKCERSRPVGTVVGFDGRPKFGEGLDACAEMLEVSLVTNPAQKYSVGFLHNGTGGQIDQYDYTVIRFVAERLQSPFHRWYGQWTTAFHPHSDFESVGRNLPCPCGRTDASYTDCCAEKPGVEMPHFQVQFEYAPLKGVSMFEYSDSVKGGNTA